MLRRDCRRFESTRQRKLSDRDYLCCIFLFFWVLSGTGTSSSVAVASSSSSTALFFPSAFDSTAVAVGSIVELLETLVLAAGVAAGEEKVRDEHER